MASTTQQKTTLLIDKEKQLRNAASEAEVSRIHASGRLTLSERIDLFFDAGSFVELDKFIAHRCTHFGMDAKKLPGDGVVTGYGKVNGRTVYLFAQDFSVIGGSLGEMHANKIVKCIEKAILSRSPVVGMNDSGGARIQEGVEGLIGYGKIFAGNVEASGVVPQIAAIMGPCAGGAVYSPALMDFIYMVDKDYARMFITGPEVVQSVTGETVSPMELGGAMTHNRQSGNAHFVAASDADCIAQIKHLLGFLPSSSKDTPPRYHCTDPVDRRAAELNTIVPDQGNKPYDMKALIRMVVDNGDIYEVQPYFAMNIVTCFARMNGETVGIIANQPMYLAGCLDINASDKAARFIRFCDCFNIPLVTFVDVPGYLPGTEQEFGGIIRHGAKLLYAYPEATVPKITVVIRKAYGGAYIGMCSGKGGPDMVIAWPTAEIAVMGADGAAKIIFRKFSAENKSRLVEEYKEKFASPYPAAERGYVDRIIVPDQTRPAIINALEMLRGKTVSTPDRKHGNMPL
ncbi:methylmalonyl-CoA carboxyltransferase [Desulfosarcina sp. OttesenSCG-928-A07]|nr:methylmalonyl-CoA carboxyltransferase [Desulfosarcina sp. OttesenSCG-928-G17]MDL2328973.1 methylmalonyl-CoA carboxyltransferase [Desulfosarcina sp. OttesenSCG-928-A07]